MSHAISLINESQLLTYKPVDGAVIHYHKIGKKRYNDIVRECRIDDRGPTPIDKDVVQALVSEIIEKDGTFKNIDEQEVSSRVVALLLVGQAINKTNWSAVQVRTLLWAIKDWEGIGFDATEGTAPLTEDSVQALSDTGYGAELFQLVIADVNAMRLKEGASADPLGNSNGTLNSTLTTSGVTAKRATKSSPKTTANHPALNTKKATASTRKKGR